MSDLTPRLNGAINALKQEFTGLRTGRASPALLDSVMVEAYGAPMPINQVGTVTAAEARLLTVNVWDKGLVGAVEKAIRDAGLGLNPASDGQLVRVPLPELNEQRRQELVKLARKVAEESRIAIRNIRRDGMDAIKKEKDAGLGEDDAKRAMETVEKEIETFIKQVDDLLAVKEKDILTV
ncbi:MAG: ribosome recycling factor [Alphaproteobacteria bacterium]|jgi:ribosome recycling factor|nr:ribosome recycling factor [Alphaproteobacteria bacterium]